MRTLLLRLIFAVYLVAVGVLVWSPAPDDVQQTGILAAVARWVAQFGLPYDPTWTVLEVAGNVVLLVPFGVLAMSAFSWMRVWSTAAAGLATSAIIEGVQLCLPTRFSTVSDLVANTAGALLGALAVALWRARVSAAAPRPS